MVTNAALELLGRLLAGRGMRRSLVIVGGVALRLRGIITRNTEDVDVIASIDRTVGELIPPDRPLDADLLDVASVVAKELDLADDWLNSVVAAQWDGPGLPPGMIDRLEWRTFGGLELGIAGIQDLIALKLFAVVDERRDQRPQRKHEQDLIALAPTDTQLDAVREWVAAQDASPDWPRWIEETIEHVRHYRR